MNFTYLNYAFNAQYIAFPSIVMPKMTILHISTQSDS